MLRDSERSRLLIEYLQRAEAIDELVASIVRLTEARQPFPVQANCRSAVPADRAKAEAVALDARDSKIAGMKRELESTASGVAPFISTSPAYANQHLLVLMAQIDENFGDRLSRDNVTWSVPRERQQSSLHAQNAVHGLRGMSICALIASSEQVALYGQIRSYGVCAYDRGAGGYACHLDLAKHAGWDAGGAF